MVPVEVLGWIASAQWILLSLTSALTLLFGLRMMASPPVVTRRDGAPARSHVVLVITAHPDDECMFFAPSILSLRRQGHRVHVLCCSAGDFRGLGALRAGELHEATRCLGLEPSEVVLLRDRCGLGV